MADRVGQQLGNYRVIRLIGRGGFAEVYLGEHIYLKTQVAVKLLRTTLGNQQDLDSFLKEAQTIAHLLHPNIIRVIDFGVDGEIPYLVMDYAPNGTLRQRHPRGTPLLLTTIIPYIKHASAALQFAHEQKLVHRDVKPENMLVGRHNEILLSDFGIALITQSSRYQNTQDVIGTVAYMSPEQIQGKPRPASDQYSLAIVVYEWLSGDRPFHGSFTELCTQHMFAPPPPLHEKIPTISPDVEQVVTTALAKDPKQRFGSVQAFANALEQASQSKQSTFEKLQASPPSPAPAVEKPIAPPPLPPTQLAAVSPLPPTLYGGGSPLQEAKLSTSDSIPAKVKPVTGPSGGKVVPTESRDEKVNIWKIGKRQVVAAIICIVLFGVLDYVLGTLSSNAPGNSPLFNPIGGLSFSPSFIGVLYGVIFSVPLFFAVEFGPWVGLASVVIGVLLGDYAAFHSLTLSYWYLYASDAIFAFIPGLALLKTRGRYDNWRAITTAVIMSAIGIIVSNIFEVIGDSIAYHVVPFNDFLALTLLTIPTLILLPILLVIYNRIANRGKSTSTVP